MKKGFTLAELLAVIALLALLMSVSYPLLLNQFEKKQEEISQYKLDLIYSAAENHVKSNINTYPYKTGNVACIYLKKLIDDNLIQIDVSEVSENKIVKLVMKGNSGYNTSLVDECTDTYGTIYKTRTYSTSEIKNSVKITNDRVYYFENNILVREINNIAIQNQDKESSTSFELATQNYKDLYNVLNRDGIYTTFDHGDKTSTMFIDINYNDEHYVDDVSNITIYTNASLFIKYNKNTSIDNVKTN